MKLGREVKLVDTDIETVITLSGRSSCGFEPRRVQSTPGLHR